MPASRVCSASVVHAELEVCVADKPENYQEAGYRGMRSKSIGSPGTPPRSIVPLPPHTCHGLLSPKSLWETLSSLNLFKLPLEAR